MLPEDEMTETERTSESCDPFDLTFPVGTGEFCGSNKCGAFLKNWRHEKRTRTAYF